MTRTAQPTLSKPMPTVPREIRLEHSQISWRVCADYDWLVRGPAAPNWSRLASCPTAELIKRSEVREVWRVALRDRLFYAKIYFATDLLTRIKSRIRGAAPHLEWRTGWYALKHGVPSIVPVACGLPTSKDDSLSGVLVTAALEDSVPVDTYWETIHGGADRRRIIRSVAELTEALAEAIAHAHHGGFEHFDMHVGNLLVQQQDAGHVRVAFVDLHTVKVNRPINKRDVVRNLAQLNQWFMRHATRTERLRFLRRYLKWRRILHADDANGRCPDLDVRRITPVMEKAARRHSSRLWAKRDRRTMRNNKYFARLKFARGWSGQAYLQAKRTVPGSRSSQLHFSPEEWEQWLANPSRWLAGQARGRVLKESHSGKVIKASLPVEHQPLAIIVKTRRPRTRFKKILGAFRRSRDVYGWQAGYALINRDVPTARPLAVLERRVLGLLRKSVLITENIEGAVDLDRFVLEQLPRLKEPIARREKDAMIETLVRLLKRMSDRGFIHRDCKASNIMLKPAEDAGDLPQAWFVDVDGLRRRRSRRRAREFGPLVRLSVSLEVSPHVTRTDRLRFLKRFLLSPGRSDRHWKDVWARISRDVDRKRIRKHRRDQWKLKHYGQS